MDYFAYYARQIDQAASDLDSVQLATRSNATGRLEALSDPGLASYAAGQMQDTQMMELVTVLRLIGKRHRIVKSNTDALIRAFGGNLSA